jgi:hypothetical protein
MSEKMTQKSVFGQSQHSNEVCHTKLGNFFSLQKFKGFVANTMSADSKKEKKKSAVKKPETMRCDYCKRDVFHCKRCGVCKKAQYCSPLCQKDDWSEVRTERKRKKARDGP